MTEALTRLGVGGPAYRDGDRPKGREWWRKGTTVALLSTLSACVSGGADTRPGHAICRPAAAKALIGKAAPDDTAILRQVGGNLVRRIAPGDAITKDFRENRVTVTIDHTGSIVDASCG